MSRRNEDGIPLPDDEDMNLGEEDEDYQEMLEEVAAFEEERARFQKKVNNATSIFLGVTSLVHLGIAIDKGASSQMGGMLYSFGWVILSIFLIMWLQGVFNNIFDNTSPEDLQQAADERANKMGRAPSWHPDHIP